MKKKGPFILIIVLVILLLAYYGLSARNKAQEEAKKEDEIKVTDLEADDITSISYDMGNGTMSFEKDGDTWYYTADKDFPLKQSYAEGFAETLSQIKADRELEDADAMADYGLDDPTYTAEVTDKEGTMTKISFGNATGDDYYVTVGDTQKVYTVAASALDDFQTSLDDMAQLDEYPSIGSGNLKKEVITENGKTTTYDSEDEDQSEDIAAVAGGLGAVTLSSAADYSVEDKDLEKYGLDDSAKTTVEVTYTQNEKDKTLMLYIGGEDGDGNKYVMLNDSRIVYLISDEICKNILNQ